MYKLGLKLWSINTDYYYDEAIRLYKNGYFDYIELYIVPDSVEHLGKWSKINIPFTLHAPHFMHEINLACKDKENYNIAIYKQVAEYANTLNAEYVVVHGGIEGELDETIRQFNLIKKDFNCKLLIENKPYVAPIGGKFCRGATVEEIRQIIQGTDCGFCLDIGHAVCSANYIKKDIYDYIKEYNKFNPTCYHFSDNDVTSIIDKHFHFGDGNFDFKKILSIINDGRNIAIETKKNSKTDLNDFINDVKYLRSIA